MAKGARKGNRKMHAWRSKDPKLRGKYSGIGVTVEKGIRSNSFNNFIQYM